MIMVKGMKSFVRDLILENKGKFALVKKHNKI